MGTVRWRPRRRPRPPYRLMGGRARVWPTRRRAGRLRVAMRPSHSRSRRPVRPVRAAVVSGRPRRTDRLLSRQPPPIHARAPATVTFLNIINYYRYDTRYIQCSGITRADVYYNYYYFIIINDFVIVVNG